MSSLDGLHGDVVVVGGGPAGLAAAIALRMHGLSVTVADARRPPIDAACGEGILPAGVAALRQLGVPLRLADGFVLRGIRFVEGRHAVEAPFSAAHGIGIRRTRLHQLLTGRAAESGVRLVWGTSVCGSKELSGFEWVVGADGRHSRVREWARLGSMISLSRRFGFRRHYRVAPWTDRVEVHWGTRCQMYITPIASDEIGVALLTRDPHQRVDDALAEFPRLRRKLADAEWGSAERGSITATNRLRCVYRGQTALVGDASGSVDAIAGEGLSLSFLQAIALADAIAAGDLRTYQATHRAMSRRPLIMAGLLLLLDRLAPIRPIVWRGLALDPGVLGHVLAFYSPGASQQLL